MFDHILTIKLYLDKVNAIFSLNQTDYWGWNMRHGWNMSMKLAENAIMERVQQWKNNNFRFLSRDLRAIATKYGYLEDSAMSAVSQRSVLSNSGRCFICPRTMDRKSKNICTHCKQCVCKDHLIVLCLSCDSRKA